MNEVDNPNNSKKKDSELKVFCVFSKEDTTFSDVTKQVFQEYLRNTLKQNG